MIKNLRKEFLVADEFFRHDSIKKQEERSFTERPSH